MDAKQFDRFAKFMTRGSNRRNAMKTLAVGALGGAGLVSAAGPAAAADAPGEEWVQLYESMAAAVNKLNAGCDIAVQTLKDWETKNAARIAEMQRDIETWTAEQRAAHWTAYSQRIHHAAASLTMAFIRCGYATNSTSPYTEADLNSDRAVATPAASTLDKSALFYADQATTVENLADINLPCDCDCACNPGMFFTVGNCLGFSAVCLLSGGTRFQACCYTTICVAGYNHDQCVHACEDCCGCV